ncbi:MAG: putative lipid II flippase FtsW [bacterium]
MKIQPNSFSEDKKKIDQFLLYVTLALLVIGIGMVYSTSQMFGYKFHNRDSFYYLRIQLIACLLGLSGMIFSAYFDYKYYKQLAKPMLIGSVILLMLVFSPLGISIKNSTTGREFHRWIRIFGQRFQPVEIAKLVLVIYVAQFLSSKSDRIRSLIRGILPNVLVLSVFFLLIYAQPDFGSAVLISTVVVIMLFAGGARTSQIAMIAMIACFFLYRSIEGDEYKLQRIQDFINSWQKSEASNYQVEQSLNALALGGLSGVGVGQSIYKLSYLPCPHTDFVFAIIGEEMGFFGGLIVIVLFMALVCRGFQIAMKVKDTFGSMLATGISSMLGLQTIVNIGVVTGVLPTKGITLPLISYGGSSLVLTLVSIGILLNISRHVEV